MLDRDALAQLKGLKTQIESEKERTEAVLRGTPARYGFARTDDGREVFVPPDEMLKAFPGDRIRVCLRPGKDKRPIAEIEGLVDCPIGEFTGRCVSKGKAMFVEPDIPGVNRWLFLPPQARNGAKAGDFLRCALQRHPIRDGKPQAKVLATIGAADDPGIENSYTMAKYGLERDWPEDKQQELEALLGSLAPENDDHREDFSDLAFVTIDAARTQDIDDALYAEVTNDGWLLYVAIADPTAYVTADSPLRATVAARASSAYFHGAVVPMLPESIAQQRCALTENELRPALVCRVAIAEDGSVGEFKFFEAKIRSRAKLSYFAVDRYLSGQDEALICHATPLEALYQVSRALRTRREAEELVMEDRQEFRWLLDDRGHIDSIEPCEKLSSQRLVEECMVATNRCAAMFLADANASGPFVVHDGFRRDRLKDRAKFLELYVEDADKLDPDSLEGYRDLLRRLAASEHELPLRSMVNRLLTRARLSKNPGAHMGMSLALYTNCTSPLRKYLDFLVHLQIKAALRGEKATLCEQPELDALTQKLQKLRNISNEAERWLTLEYLQRQAESTPGPWQGEVSHMGNHGFYVRLAANGLEGYVDLRKAGEKFHFDKWTATLKSKTREFRVGTPVNVTLIGSDDETAHLPLFKLDANSGRKLEVITRPGEPPASESA
ncbi:VacB/RNase II family 3'-5' exoribonuclease [Congregibacter litoralis]|uniref:exoribonuclease II n=1 Tax=Congregibacter litoralis KT71 TaxID=314285 RepID=A4A6L6_9GAMM|nr:VacB/RNase II family 3'-5' exoribonuclease [Congregibacter litoralis]EAQ98663.1 RNAse R [Congregibacter litoralis KT71]